MKRFDTINVIPFIDIMLVLLAIVLTTATFIAQGLLEIELPESKAAAPDREQKRIELAIDRDEQIYYEAKPVNLETLRSQLGHLPGSTPIVLRVDARVPFGRFVAVVDVLKALRLDSLSILTKEAG